MDVFTTQMTRSLALAPTLALLASCTSGTEPGSAPPPGPPAVGATYHGAVRAIFEEHCVNCHVLGGVGPFPLTDYASSALYSFSLLPAVEAGYMPPWLPSADCKSYEGERRLSPEALAALREWVEAGTPEGDPSEYTPPPPKPSPLEAMGPPALVLGPDTGYVPRVDGGDDYHCFPLDHEFEEESYLVLTHVLPERKEIVHHVILFLISPQFVPQLETLDAAEEGPGYTCFGGPGAGPPQNVGAWVPGAVPSPIQADDSGGQSSGQSAAIRVPKGSRLVMQVHYNTVFADPVPDRTEVQLWFSDQRPDYLVRVQAFPHLGIQIPAGASSSRHVREFRNNSGEPWTAVATAMHMHTLGTKIGLEVLRDDNSAECVIDIPRWDFHWQQAYRFLPGQEVTVMPGERVRLSCEYDNSAANQPVIDGVPRTPVDVRWGEGTLDEMCLGYLMFLEPYEPLPELSASCPTFQGCYDSCIAGPTPRSGCVLQCAGADGDGCSQCVVGGMMQCVLQDCPAEVGDMLQCLESCQATGDTRGCVRTMCIPQLLGFDACAAPKLAANECDSYVSTCDADL